MNLVERFNPLMEMIHTVSGLGEEGLWLPQVQSPHQKRG